MCLDLSLLKKEAYPRLVSYLSLRPKACPSMPGLRLAVDFRGVLSAHLALL